MVINRYEVDVIKKLKFNGFSIGELNNSQAGKKKCIFGVICSSVAYLLKVGRACGHEKKTGSNLLTWLLHPDG